MPSPKLDIARLRMHAGHLTGSRCATAAEVVRELGAVQAQDFAGAKWGVAQRTTAMLDRDVERAFETGEILRTHVLRPTWHFVVPADLRWLLALSAPRVKQAMATYDRKLALDERTYARSNHAIAEALAGGNHLTRNELARVLAKIKIDALSQRLGHLMMRAELDAVICSGPRRGKQMTYALISERCAPAPALDRDDALGKLARRYIASHGPAVVHDFAWWSGLTITDAKRGLELARPTLASAVVDERTYWFTEPLPPAASKQPVVHLLPNYDEYMVAYKYRSAASDASLATTLDARGNLLFNNLVVLNGQPIGIWRRTVVRAAVTVTATLATTLARPAQRALDAAVDQFGVFLGVPARLAPLP